MAVTLDIFTGGHVSRFRAKCEREPTMKDLTRDLGPHLYAEFLGISYVLDADCRKDNVMLKDLDVEFHVFYVRDLLPEFGGSMFPPPPTHILTKYPRLPPGYTLLPVHVRRIVR